MYIKVNYFFKIKYFLSNWKIWFNSILFKKEGDLKTPRGKWEIGNFLQKIFNKLFKDK